jgi:type II secretory pathway component PulK
MTTLPETTPNPANAPRPVRRVPARTVAGGRGIAVLLVLACLAILAPFTASFNYQARVDWQSAVNVRDEIAARNIQRGAMQLSLLLFEIQRLVFNQKQFRDMMGTMDITQVAPYLMSVFGTTDGAQGLGDLVGIDTTALSGLAVQGGSFEYRVSAESGKINVNCLAKQAKAGEKDNAAGRVVETLEALMSPTLYDPLFEEEKADAQYYTRTDIIRALADYVDDDRNRFDIIKLRSGSAAENDRYGELFDPYIPRNARLDSIEELHLVAGIDDDWMAAFGQELTVYGGCKVNLNFASAEQIALVIRHSVSAADRWKTEADNFMIKTMPLANYVVDMREFNLFEKLDDFKQLVAKPDEFVNPMMMLGQDPSASQQLPRIPEGIEVRVKPPKNEEDNYGALQEVATVSAERIYRVELITTVGAVNKRLIAVYDMQYARSQSQGKGAWMHVRED